MLNTSVSVHFRHEDGLSMSEPEAAWESPAFLCFASVAELKAAAARQGVAGLLFDDEDALFPAATANTARAPTSPVPVPVIFTFVSETSETVPVILENKPVKPPP